ncbi:MAG: N-6 DNA methylase [Cyanobacteria bacterium]|nr:N-6 DNA methylase [Cyanobacteriota bacterium]
MQAEKARDTALKRAVDFEQTRPLHAGVYYTPPLLARWVTAFCLSAYCKTGDLNAPTIIDPACGSGIFLAEALYFLWHRRQESAYTLCKTSIWGVDTDAEAIETARHILLELICSLDTIETAQDKKRVTEMLIQQISVDNPLSADTRIPLAHWDMVLGNPPYMQPVRKHSKMSDTVLKAYAPGKADLCDAFVLLGLKLLKDSGHFAWILPAYWQDRYTSKYLREVLLSQSKLEYYWSFDPKTPLFSRATGHQSSILVGCKQSQTQMESQSLIDGGTGHLKSLLSINPEDKESLPKIILKQQGKQSDYRVQLFFNPLEPSILERLSGNGDALLPPSTVQQGVILPQDRLTQKAWKDSSVSQQTMASPGAPIFIFSQDEIINMALNDTEKQWFRPYCNPKSFQSGDFQSGIIREWLLYANQDFRRTIKTRPKDFPCLKQHLERMAPWITSSNAPYGLHRARQATWFESPHKLLGLRQCKQPGFMWLPQPAYVNQNFNVIDANRFPHESPFYQNPATLCQVLNSIEAAFWWFHTKRKGDRLQLDKDALLSLPAAIITPLSQTETRYIQDWAVQNGFYNF